MNQKVLLLTGLGVFVVILYTFVVVSGRYAANPVPASTIFLLVYVTLTAIVIVWKPDPPA
jgi:hypothetical protein